MTNILIYPLILCILLITLAICMLIYSWRDKRIETQEDHLDNLEQQIIENENIITQQQTIINTNEIDNKTNLTHIENKVLNQYDESGIKIPLDIIEDLNHMKLTTEKEIQNYIENQRNYWKLENSKKPFKRS